MVTYNHSEERSDVGISISPVGRNMMKHKQSKLILTLSVMLDSERSVEEASRGGVGLYNPFNFPLKI